MNYLQDCPHRSPAFKQTSKPLQTDCFYNMPVDGEAGFCKMPQYYRCIEDVKRMIVPLSYSSMSNFLTCHNLFYLRNIRGIEMIESKVSSAIKMGVLWDVCLQKLLGGDIRIKDTIETYEIENIDIARVKGLFRAYKELGIEVPPGYEMQHRFKKMIKIYDDEAHGENSGVLINGIFDRKYENSFAENKLSSRPNYYFDIFFIQSQIGAYFLADNKLEWVDMEVVRTPALKSQQEEQPEEYEERVFTDAISRPSFYFIGYNKNKRSYGRKFYRSEFNLDEILQRFKSVSREIHEACALGGFYKNDRACSNILPGIACEMIGICRYNTMAENTFRIREVPTGKMDI